MSVVDVVRERQREAAKPLLDSPPPRTAMTVLAVGVAVPFLALVAAIPFAWGWGLSWLDAAIAGVFYVVSGFGVTVGLHRYLTHGSFKAVAWLRAGLAVVSIPGPPLAGWVHDVRWPVAERFAARRAAPPSPVGPPCP